MCARVKTDAMGRGSENKNAVNIVCLNINKFNTKCFEKGQGMN